MDSLDTAAFTPRRMPHADMVRHWRARRAVTVSARITDYARCDGAWWRRHGGDWESIPDGPFALSLSVGRARLARLDPDGGYAGRRDPWAVARDRLRMGGACPNRR